MRNYEETTVGQTTFFNGIAQCICVLEDSVEISNLALKRAEKPN